MKADTTNTGEPAIWNFKLLILALGLGIILQSLLVTLDGLGTAKLKVSLMIYGLLIGRVALAWLFKERGGGWKAYSAIALLSPLYVELVGLFVFP